MASRNRSVVDEVLYYTLKHLDGGKVKGRFYNQQLQIVYLGDKG